MSDSPYTLFIRTDCNVLEPEDCAVHEVVLTEAGAIRAITQVTEGYGSQPDLVGADLTALAEWTQFDATGSHPEDYHQVADARIGPWRDFQTAEQLAALAGLPPAGDRAGERHQGAPTGHPASMQAGLDPKPEST